MKNNIKKSFVITLALTLLVSVLPSITFGNTGNDVNGKENVNSASTAGVTAPAVSASGGADGEIASDKAEMLNPISTETAPNRDETAVSNGISDRAAETVKATFKFKYGNKKDVVLDVNKGEAIGDKYPKQDIISTDLSPDINASTKLELVGFLADGKLIKLEDMAKEVINKDTVYTAYYNVIAEYDLIVYDGRPESYHMKEADVTSMLAKDYGVKNTSTGQEYYTKWTFVKGEEQNVAETSVKRVSRFQYKGVAVFPLQNIDGTFIKYGYSKNNTILPEPFYSSMVQGNQYKNQLIYKTNYFPWFGVVISDASKDNPVSVEITLKQKYPSSYSKKVHEGTKKFNVTIDNPNGDWVELSRKNDVKTEGDNVVSWDSNGRIFTASQTRETWLVDTNAYGTTIVTAEAPELEGYTLVKRGDGLYKNDGKHNAFIFAYYKNMKLTFDAKAGGTTLKDGGKNSIEYDVLHKHKFAKGDVPEVNDIEDETFLGWADKDDASKTVIDFSNYTVEKNTVFVPVFRVHDTKNITPIDPVKTKVGNPLQLTEQEKANVKKEVEEANKGNFPDGTLVYVGDNGTVTITYPDGSTDTITPDKTIEKIATDNDSGKNDGKDNSGENDEKGNGAKPGANNSTKTAQTGDKSNKGLYAGLSVLALISAAGALSLKKRNRKA